MKKLSIHIEADSRAVFHNNAAFCVGTGRMGLALQQEYQEQLALAQAECHFQHIRGHGLFSDDMAIYQCYRTPDGVEHISYNFTYLDRVMDYYKAQGIRPFLELGFMPEKMASGTQTIFYWKGNTTPPAEHERWAELIRVTLKHLAERYGYEEVTQWPCEIWNEPNLPGFWQNADKEKYLQLYEVSVKAVKEVMPDMKVGGPAICGGAGSQEWIRDLLTFCRKNGLPIDFVSRHAYMGETPQRQGRYLYHTMRTVDSILEEMTESRRIIDSFPEYAGIPLHITEFNTSYHPFCPIHDTNYNAALTAGLLACLGDVAASYSYWTFGDVFEEQGVPSRPFHGGFGLIANGLIAKPTLWTFAFFNNLKGTPVYRDEHVVVVQKTDGTYEGVAWNICQKEKDHLTIELTLPEKISGVLMTETVDEVVCNPLKAWHEIGEPSSLTAAQLRFLRQAGQPLCETSRIEGGKVKLLLRANAVMRFTAAAVNIDSDEGYDYQWYIQNR